MIDLRSDNTAAACPQVLGALLRGDDGREASYGDDAMTSRLRDQVRAVFEHPDAEVFPVVTGTAANALSLSAICQPWGSVLCHESAHIANYEAGATSHLSGGAVLRTVAGVDGTIDVTALATTFDETWWGDPHVSQPQALSLVYPTDLGTVPSVEQIRELTAAARVRGLRCHLDGARIANGLVSAGCTPADLTWRTGIDVVSFGATKNGGMNADMIVSFDTDLSAELRFRTKRAGHVPSKMRYLSAQILALMENDLWLQHAAHANAMATRIGSALTRSGHPPLYPIQANLVFVELTDRLSAILGTAGVEYFELRPGIARFVTSWQTKPDEVKTLVQALTRD